MKFVQICRGCRFFNLYTKLVTTPSLRRQHLCKFSCCNYFFCMFLPWSYTWSDLFLSIHMVPTCSNTLFGLLLQYIWQIGFSAKFLQTIVCPSIYFFRWRYSEGEIFSCWNRLFNISIRPLHFFASFMFLGPYKHFTRHVELPFLTTQSYPSSMFGIAISRCGFQNFSYCCFILLGNCICIVI